MFLEGLLMGLSPIKPGPGAPVGALLCSAHRCSLSWPYILLMVSAISPSFLGGPVPAAVMVVAYRRPASRSAAADAGGRPSDLDGAHFSCL